MEESALEAPSPAIITEQSDMRNSSNEDNNTIANANLELASLITAYMKCIIELSTITQGNSFQVC